MLSLKESSRSVHSWLRLNLSLRLALGFRGAKAKKELKHPQYIK